GRPLPGAPPGSSPRRGSRRRGRLPPPRGSPPGRGAPPGTRGPAPRAPRARSSSRRAYVLGVRAAVGLRDPEVDALALVQGPEAARVGDLAEVHEHVLPAVVRRE